MSPDTIVEVVLIIALAYFMFGVSGFGSSLVAVPLLSFVMPLQSAVMLALTLDLISAIALSKKENKHVRTGELKVLIPFVVLGIVMGALLLARVPNEPLLLALGFFVTAVGIKILFFGTPKERISKRWSALAGIAGGTTSALFGTGGPAYMSYLGHRLENRFEIRATFSGLLVIDSSLRVFVFVIGGLFFSSLDLIVLAAALPTMVIGLYMGHRAHDRLSDGQMTFVTALLLLASGVSLIVRGFSN